MLSVVGVEWPARSSTREWYEDTTKLFEGPFTPSRAGEKEGQDEAFRGRRVLLSNYISAPL